VSVADAPGGSARAPSNATCCIEITLRLSTDEKLTAARYWYYKKPKLKLKAGEHVQVRRLGVFRGGVADLQVRQSNGHVEALMITRSEKEN